MSAGRIAPFDIEVVTTDPEGPEWAERYDEGAWYTPTG